MPHLRRLLLALFVLTLLVAVRSAPASAQSVESVVDNMQAAYEQQLESVDTYIVETNLYTSFHEKVTEDGEPTYRTSTQMKGTESPSFASSNSPSMAYGFHFDQLRQTATFDGTESVDGTQAYVLRVDNPSAVDPDMDESAQGVTYYIDAERYFPIRMVMQSKPQGNAPGGGSGSTVTVNMKNYQTVDGLTLPHRMEMQVDMNMSDQQRQQMKKMLKKLENLPEQQRKQMEKMLGDQMGMMKQMFSGEPVVVEVQSVQVNTEIPEGIF